MLRVAGDPTTSNFLSVDKKRKQLTLQEPGNGVAAALGSSPSSTLSSSENHQGAPDDRRVGVAAPKMFAFDGLFTADDSQVRTTTPFNRETVIVTKGICSFSSFFFDFYRNVACAHTHYRAT